MVCCVGSGVIDVPLIAAASPKIFESTSQATDESRRNQKNEQLIFFLVTHQHYSFPFIPFLEKQESCRRK